ncbi:MAG TPA: polysaccharide deacetylase family protein [Gemmatimonadaceae bacterium]|nr:polysaccharide deacetylase family protein [Gemmatimonadaceae bacterium]
MIVEAAIGAVVAGGIAHGMFYRNSPIFGRVLRHLPPSAEPTVALTFDDGPNPEATPALLDALAGEGIHATFFILGRHADRWPELVRRITADGHMVGNHGYFHRKLHLKSPRYVRQDLELGTRIIEQASGVRPTVFRAPHGFRSPWVTGIARSLGQRTVGWSLGVWDSDRPGVEEIVKRTVEGARPGSILLLHDGDGYDARGDRMQTARAVPIIIDSLRAQGYRFVTLDAA